MKVENLSRIKIAALNGSRCGVVILLLFVAACDNNNNSNNIEVGSEPLGMVDAARNANLEVGVAVANRISVEEDVVIVREFTSITSENAMKWSALEPAPGQYDFSVADQQVESAVANGQRIRGHTLFWHRVNGLPSWFNEELAKASDPAAYLRELMVVHANTVVGRYAGRLAQWDVVNEPLSLVSGAFDPENIYYRLLGEEYLDIALLQAHAADPSAELFINETFTEFVPEKFEALLALAQRLLDRGVPLHGLGLQGHFFFRAPDEAILRDQLQRISAMGLKVEITELDIPLPLFKDYDDPLAAQAQAYVEVFSACLAVTSCSGITVWGLEDSGTWLDSFELTAANAPNRPLLFDEALNAKPAHDRVRQLLGEISR